MYLFCKIYQGDYIFKDDYIGETECNIITCWSEPYNPTQDSPAQHLKNSLNHKLNWLIVAKASSNKLTQKKLESNIYYLNKDQS